MIVERGLELLRERLRVSRPLDTPQAHARAAVDWLFAAQDAPGDGGVSHSYLIGQRWMRSYPETTGYIIPTLLNWSRAVGEPQAERRALRMADWELGCQLPDGAVPELTSGQPTVFDTGQVIFGWVAAYRHTSEAKYLQAAQRAGAWLLSQLDAEGVWRHASDAGGPGRVYNVRAAWAVLELAAAARDDRYVAPMRRFLDWTLGQERSPGWYDCNCLTDDTAPLLHTIAYTAQGHLECGRLLDDPRLVESARATSLRLMELVGPDGRLAGRFGREFRPAVGWACLTGMAQMGIVWRRLAARAARAANDDAGGDAVNARAHADARAHAGDSTTAREAAQMTAAAARVCEFLMRTQDRSSTNPGMRGGIRGSYPVNGAYGQWRVLNWATKFFVDAAMAGVAPEFFIYEG